jgi:lysine decarboxylase
MLSALRRIAGDHAGNAALRPFRDKDDPAYERGRGPAVLERTPREVYFGPKDTVDLGQAQGRLAANILATYPPGVPLVYPGQRLSRETTDRILALKGMGRPVAGLLEGGRIQVCREP